MHESARARPVERERRCSRGGKGPERTARIGVRFMERCDVRRGGDGIAGGRSSAKGVGAGMRRRRRRGVVHAHVLTGDARRRRRTRWHGRGLDGEIFWFGVHAM